MLKQITTACFTSDPAIPITYREKLQNYSYMNQKVVKTEISILCYIWKEPYVVMFSLVLKCTLITFKLWWFTKDH